MEAKSRARLDAFAKAPRVHAALVNEAAALTGARRVLLVRQGRHAGDARADRRIVAARLPRGQRPPDVALMRSWLDDVSRTRKTRLRRSSPRDGGTVHLSSLVAPLVANDEVLGFLYADVPGSTARFGEAERTRMADCAARGAASLARMRGRNAMP